MNNILKKELYEWVYEKIKADPKKFGGDNSNALIMQEYSKEFHNEESISNLNKEFFSILSTVSRIKNKLLEKNPHFDFRNKNVPKYKR